MKRTYENGHTKKQYAKRTKQQSTPNRSARRALARTLGVEQKYFDVAVGFVVPSTVDWQNTAIGVDMPQLVQGDDIVNRNGRKVQLNKVVFKGTMMSNVVVAGSSVTPPNTVRVVLVLNKQPNALTTTLGQDVMGLNGAAAANTSVAIHMFQGIQSFGRFKVVDDILINLDATAAVNNAAATSVSAVAQEKSFTLSYRPKKPLIIEYAGTATTFPNTNAFNILCNAENTAYGANLQGVCRFYFTDV